MKTKVRILSFLLSLALILGLLPSMASALSISDSGFTKIGSIPNDYVATQGMCTDGTYIYTFKMPSGNNNLARFYRTSISSGETVLMKATFDTSLTNFLALGHGNDMCAVVHNGVTYLYLATMYNRNHSEFATHSIWKFKVTGSNLEKVAYYDVIEYGTDDMDFTGLTVYKQTDTHVTLLSADGKYIYTIELGLNQGSGTVDCTWLCTINYMTAPTPTGAPTYRFKDSNGNSYYGVQGMTYDNGKLYYVLTGSQTTATAKDNYIFCYDLENYTNKKSVEAIAAESIYVTSSYYAFFLEFESIDIHNGVMYFSANAGKSGYYENYDFCGKLKKTFTVTPEYTVTFCNEAGTTLQSVKVKKGETAKYTGSTPTKAYDATNHYTFSNKWLTSVGGSEATLTNITANLKVYAGFTATAHSYTEEVTTQPSCSVEGSKTLTCSCGRSYTEAIAKTEHTPTVVNAKAATCSAEGYSGDTVCSVCNASIASGTVIEKLPHTPVTDKGYAATCTSYGLSDGSHCGVCGEILAEQTVLPMAEHNAVVILGTPATCLNSGISDGLQCADCGYVMQAQTVISRLGHDYRYANNGDNHIGTCSRCSKTVTQNHSFTDGACICGAKDVILDENIQIYHTLDLASDISITFAVPKTALADYDSYYMECALPEYEGNTQVGTSTVQIQPVVNGNYYYFTLTGITAVRMGDMVDAVLHMTKGNQEYISKTDSYSVASYAYAMLNSSKDEKMLALCADLLRYGAEAQTFKKYRLDSLVDANMTEAHRSYLSNTDALTFTATDSNLGDLASPVIPWVGKTLDLGSKVGMKFVFNAKNYSGDVSKLSMKVSYTGSTGEVKTVTVTGAEVYNAANAYYSFTFYGLLASELRTVVDVAIYNGNTQLSEALRYSAETYASKTAGTTLESLTRALFAYSDSAKAYFTK